MKLKNIVRNTLIAATFAAGIGTCHVVTCNTAVYCTTTVLAEMSPINCNQVKRNYESLKQNEKFSDLFTGRQGMREAFKYLGEKHCSNQYKTW